jgi:hypothetical protein
MLDTSNNVGIGTATPFSRLHVQQSGENILNLTNSSATSNQTWGVAIGSGGQVGHGQFMISTGFGVPQVANAQLRLLGDGQTVIGNSTNPAILYTGSNQSFAFKGNFTPTTNGSLIKILPNNGGNLTATSGNQTVFNIQETFAPTSGNATFDMLYLEGSYAQSGTANGIVSSLNISPSIGIGTSDYRAIRLQNTSGRGISQESAGATNYFAGNLGIGTTNPGAKLEVSGASGDIAYFGNGSYTGKIGLDGTGMYFNHNSATRNLSFGVNGARDNLVISTAGNLGIGTTNPGQKLDVQTTAATPVAKFTNSVGYCEINPVNTALSCVSDQTLKKNVETLQEGVLNKVLGLRPVSYQWLSEDAEHAKHDGFIAQEVETLFPSLVATNASGTKSLNYAGLTPFLAKAIQELSAEIKLLKVTTGQSLADSQELIVKSHVTFSGDTVGLAKVKPGDKAVKIQFEKPYSQVPLVSLTRVGKADTIFAFTVSTTTREYFEISIGETQNEDVVFSWYAFGQSGAKLSVSDGSIENVELFFEGAVKTTPQAQTPVPLTASSSLESVMDTIKTTTSSGVSDLEVQEPVQISNTDPENSITTTEPETRQSDSDQAID